MGNWLKEKFKSDDKEKFTATAFLLLIFSMFFGMFFHVADVGAEFINAYRANAHAGASLIERFSAATAAAEPAASAGVPGRPQYIEVFGLAQLAMGKRIVADPNYGALYKTPSGQLAYAVEEKYLGGYLDNLYEMVNWLRLEEIPFLYVQAPFKLRDAHSQLPPTVADYSNSDADRFIESLAAASVTCFDLRPLLYDSGMTQEEMFYGTDHHWTIDAAFFSAGKIAEKLNEDYGFKIDKQYFDVKNYNRKTYEKSFVGSLGRRVGRIYGGIDDFTLITPKFETSLALSENGVALPGGSFEDAVLDMECVDEKAKAETNRYAVYRKDRGEVVFENHLAHSGKILIVKDSFGIPVYTFLALGVQEVRALDVRLFDGDVSEYAKEHRPDVVILLYNPDCFNGQMFDFKGGQH
ncbi:MAG: hypothetical protein FWG53_11065 [Clostridiales bacterium]|nr:hypothetical protein [Clostridiales bacterium]